MNILISPYSGLKDWLESQGHTIHEVQSTLSIQTYTSEHVIYGQLEKEERRILSEKNIRYMHIAPLIPDKIPVDAVTLEYLSELDIKINEPPIPFKARLTNTYKSITKFFRQTWLKWKTSSLLIWLLTTLSLASFTWLCDLVAGNKLFSWLKEDITPLHQGLAVGLIYIVCSLSLIQLGRSFLPSLRRIKVTDTPEAKKILLLTISKIEGLSVNDGIASVTLNNGKGETITLSGNLEKDIEILSKTRWNGTQLLRGLAKHQKKVKQIILLSTEDVGTSEYERGTYRKVELIAEFLNNYIDTSQTELKASEVYLDPNDVGESYYLLTKILDDLTVTQGIPDKDICLDITGGTSAISAAAALATIHRNTQFQYISTIGASKVYQQDLQLAVSAARNN